MHDIRKCSTFYILYANLSSKNCLPSVPAQCRYGSNPVQTYSENQRWYDDPSFPCKQFTCTKAGVVKTQDLTERCAPLDPPDCRTERPLGECCKRCVPTREFRREGGGL